MYAIVPFASIGLLTLLNGVTCDFQIVSYIFYSTYVIPLKLYVPFVCDCMSVCDVLLVYKTIICSLFAFSVCFTPHKVS